VIFLLQSVEENRSDQKQGQNLAFARTIARVAIFSATAVAAGYLLSAIPNVELVTAIIALTGLQLGWKAGAATGILATGIYHSLNAWGFPYPPVLIAQIIVQAANGLVFGILGSRFLGENRGRRNFKYLTNASNRNCDNKIPSVPTFPTFPKSNFYKIKSIILAGILITICYDLLTNLAFPLSTGIHSVKGLVPFLLAGIPFAAIHLTSNIFIFALLVPVVHDRLKLAGTR
jgi:hypothetical protein